MPKKDIHPKYFDNANFVCTTCGNEFTCGTVKGSEVRIDVCSNCHQFYTGNQQFSNTQGRIEQFKSKFVKKDEIKANVEKVSAEQKAENAKNKKDK